ncbi:hypothetical protein J6590_030253 [Homalodisca vitripennis]|nr:hypothetical protein J6590_030253 [Homalodisca vitripennis]
MWRVVSRATLTQNVFSFIFPSVGVHHYFWAGSKALEGQVTLRCTIDWIDQLMWRGAAPALNCDWWTGQERTVAFSRAGPPHAPVFVCVSSLVLSCVLECPNTIR